MAPFWNDYYTINGGTVFYETFESGYFLEQVNAFLQRKRPTSFVGTWMLVAYYNAISYNFYAAEVCVNLMQVYICVAHGIVLSL